MAAASTTAARISQKADALYDRLRNVVQIRSDLVVLGGVEYITPALDEVPPDPDPVPDLSAAEMVQAFVAIQALDGVLSANSDTHRKGLLGGFASPAASVGRARSYIRGLRSDLADLLQLRQDCVDAGGQSWLEAELGAEDTAKVVAVMAAVQAMSDQLDANSGAQRKALRKAAD